MLLVDRRDGSNYLADPLAKLGLPVYRTTEGKLPTLESADLAFAGRGPDGKSFNVGVEFKRLSDLASSLRTGRLSGEQLPKMLGEQGAYDYAFLLIEGEWRVDKRGQVVVPKHRRWGKPEWSALPGGMPASEMTKRVLTLELCAGMHTHWVNTRDDSLQFIANLYRWWTDRSMDQHQSHLDTHKPHQFLAVNKQRQAYMCLPGIGRHASLAVEKHFGSIRQAVNATAEEWAEIEVVSGKNKIKRIGMTIASRIFDFVNGRNQS